ncbi:MAG TPA: LptF/LptG family permease [Gemmatimonadales bacterium]|nr:LptF/LptG family permease [Gemmatimonadales bacterium]
MKPLGTLDRYVIRQWIGTFMLSALGIPAVAVLIRLSEEYPRLVNKGVPGHDALLGTLLLYPGQMALLFPAAVLFATVFTLNGMGRHSELTAVKAGGVSFYRLIAPMLVLATLAVPTNYWLQEVAAVSGARQRVLHREKEDPNDMRRFNFAFRDPHGMVWTTKELARGRGYLGATLVEAPVDSTGMRWAMTADSALWDGAQHRWTFHRGAIHRIPAAARAAGDSAADSTAADPEGARTPAPRGGGETTPTNIAFVTLTAAVFDQEPGAMLNTLSNATEMRTAELEAYLDRLERIGVRPGQLAVDLPLKYAVPVACLIVALFGAPLAVTNPRAGAAMGLAIALGTTLVYLTGTQIMKAIGGKELIPVDVAAWSMNGVFLVLAVILLVRVRS